LANAKNVHFNTTNYHEALEVDKLGIKGKTVESFIILPQIYFDIVTCYIVMGQKVKDKWQN